MRSSLLLLLAGTSIALAFPPVPPPKERKARPGELSLKALEGTWSVVSYEIGRAQPNANVRILIRPAAAPTYQIVEIKNGKWTQKRTLPNGRTSQTVGYPIKLDPAKTPATFDLVNPGATAVRAAKAAVMMKTSSRLGLARLDGDQLTVVYAAVGQERPGKLDGELPVRQYRWVLKRVNR